MATIGITHGRLRTEDALEFRLIYAAGFVYFLLIALIARLMPRHYRPSPMARTVRRRSIIAEARETASSLVPFAFMR